MTMKTGRVKPVLLSITVYSFHFTFPLQDGCILICAVNREVLRVFWYSFD